MIGYKNREVKHEKAKVYFNLHKKVFSVQQAGLVVLHTEALKLSSAGFTVNEAGRQRVLKEKRKNVHAFVTGKFEGLHEGNVPEGFRRAHYNPYDHNSFVDRETLQPITEATEVILEGKKIWYR